MIDLTYILGHSLILFMSLMLLYNPPITYYPAETRQITADPKPRSVPMLANGTDSILLHIPGKER